MKDFLDTRRLGDVKQLRHEVLVLFGAARQEQTSAVAARQDADVDEDLVAKDVDVQLVGDVADQLHEHVLLVHLQQLVLRLARRRRPLGRPADELVEEVFRLLRLRGRRPGHRRGRRLDRLRIDGDLRHELLLQPLLEDVALDLLRDPVLDEIRVVLQVLLHVRPSDALRHL